jgi:hypothetical protein
MDYTIYRKKDGLGSTGYMEIGPGKYSGKHWQDGFIFVWEDAFGMAEGILVKHINKYDHFGMNDIPNEVGQKVIADWRSIANGLDRMEACEIHIALNLKASYRDYLEKEIISNKNKIAEMLMNLSSECDHYFQSGPWICILGM